MKKIFCLFIVIAIAATIAGCTSSMSYTFNVGTGDKIVVKLDTSNGLSLSAKNPITVSRDETDVSHIIFIEGDMYDDYASLANIDENVNVLESGEKDGNSYVFWNYGSEWNCVLFVNGSDTAVLIGNAISEDSARECLNSLTFSVAD